MPASSDLSDPGHLWKQKFMSGLEIFQNLCFVMVTSTHADRHPVQHVEYNSSSYAVFEFLCVSVCVCSGGGGVTLRCEGYIQVGIICW